jgi:hypothetical protein
LLYVRVSVRYHVVPTGVAEQGLKAVKFTVASGFVKVAPVVLQHCVTVLIDTTAVLEVTEQAPMDAITE